MSLFNTNSIKNKPTRHFSKKQESKIADKFSGKTTPNSGATMFRPGDVELNNMLIECKTKTSHSDSISIKKEWIEKIKKESLFSGKSYYSLIFNFGPDEDNYAIIDMELFELLLDYIKN